MAEINMNDYSTFDESVNTVEKNLSDKEKASYYLNTLTSRIEKEESIGKIRNEVYNFIYANTLMDENVKKKLLELVNGNYVDGRKLSTDILEFLKQNYNQKNEEHSKNEEDLEATRTDFVVGIEDNLSNSNVSVTGNDDEVKEALKSENDMSNLNDEVNEVRDMLKDNNDSYDLSTGDLVEAIEKPNEEVLQTKIAEQVKEKAELTITEEGTVEFTDDILNTNSQNYMAMMLGGLTTSDMNLDMYFSKEKDSSKYKVTFGNLPVKNHPENRLTADSITKIQNISNAYDSKIDYQQQLNSMSPTVGALNELVFNEAKKEGTMRVGINNKNGNYSIGFNLSEEYQPLTEAFATNGATTSIDSNENSVVRVDGDSITQTSIITNTKLTLIANEETKVIENTYQFVKKIEPPLNEAARVSPSFLTVVAIMEVILIGFYFVMIFS